MADKPTKEEKKQELQALMPLLLTFGIALVVGIGFAIYKGGEWLRVLGGGKSDAELRVDAWTKSPLLLEDVNGDGQEDLIGYYLSDYKYYAGAFDGPSGKLLWRHGPIKQVQSERVVALMTQKGHEQHLGVRNGDKLQLINLADGKMLKELVVSDSTLGLQGWCASEEAGGPMAIGIASGHRALEVDWAAGKTAVKKERPVCTSPVARGHMHQLPPSYLRGASPYAWIWTYKGVTLGLYKGKAQPPQWELQSFEGEQAEGEPRWRLDLGGPAPVMGDGDAVITGTWGKSAVSLHDAKTGKQRWQTTIPGESYARVSVVGLSNNKAYAVVTETNHSSLVVLERNTGKIEGYLGGGGG